MREADARTTPQCVFTRPLHRGGGGGTGYDKRFHPVSAGSLYSLLSESCLSRAETAREEQEIQYVDTRRQGMQTVPTGEWLESPRG